MQEEEKTAVTSAESSETPAPLEAGGAERSRTVLPEEPETDSSEKGEAKSKTPSEPKDKIKAIRTTLFHIAQEEEEEAVSLRVAYQIRQVKPAATAPRVSETEEENVRAEDAGSVSAAGRFGRRSGAKEYFPVFRGSVSGVRCPDRAVLCGHFPCRQDV